MHDVGAKCKRAPVTHMAGGGCTTHLTPRNTCGTRGAACARNHYNAARWPPTRQPSHRERMRRDTRAPHCRAPASMAATSARNMPCNQLALVRLSTARHSIRRDRAQALGTHDSPRHGGRVGAMCQTCVCVRAPARRRCYRVGAAKSTPLRAHLLRVLHTCTSLPWSSTGEADRRFGSNGSGYGAWRCPYGPSAL